ncbi:uncharacterized protein LOC134235083 [Saccostrea cucullata]|uniref:uncharacterized protein LOC134235083 n=1 Tax=Saccostrea cuccullata TaxID=36930 RepID=UPI002ED372EC
MDHHLPRLSENVYVGLCHKIGSPTEVRFRKEVADTIEVVDKPVHIMRGFDRMVSGSRREGFRLRGSDEDYMLLPPDHKVICDISQISHYRIPQITLILMNWDDLPPGFTRLNLVSRSNEAKIISSCIEINNNVFISSTLFRENYLHFLKTCNVPNNTAVPHGPCSTSVAFQGRETDKAFCFQSHHWPTSALPWIQRCRERGWPHQNVIFDILSGGFHVVPIASTPENELEWRISFSRAEQKLVYSMNHCQFLCYGLFKIFLKEVINNRPNTSNLCSYFIKTIVFWVIQTKTSLSWTPDNLLFCFWKSFKLLIYMVHTGECPNFFIPQNNMFRVKVTGSVQTSMFSQLYDLYNKGISCLLLSETLRPFLSIAILNRTLGVSTDESSAISMAKLDMCLFIELTSSKHNILDLKEIAANIKQVERIIRGGLTSYQQVILQCITSNVLRNTAMLLQSLLSQNENQNKIIYKAKVAALLKQSCKFGCLSDILYLAMYFYRTRRYEDSISCLHKAQERMSVPYIMYRNRSNPDIYRNYMERNTLGTRMRRALVRDIRLNVMDIYIVELALEQKICSKNAIWSLTIPPLVMLNMLFILNHHRLGDTVRSRQSLRDLQSLLLSDDGTHVPHLLRDISWQIVGICQQIFGDYSGSLLSYQKSLQQIPFNKLLQATLFRINSVQNEEF